MATDFVHTEEIVDAVLAVLAGADGASHTGGLPAEFWTGAAALKLCEHGDLSDWVTVKEWEDRLLPGILVRGMGTQRGEWASTTGGGQGTTERVRVVHLRSWDQCYTDAGAKETNMSRARERYAKLIGKALFHDPMRVLATIGSTGTRTNPALTSADGTGAGIKTVQFAGWDLGQGSGGAEEVTFARTYLAAAQVWAIACDLDVQVLSGP